MRCSWLIVFVLGCSSTPAGKPQPYVEVAAKGSGAVVDELVVAVSALRSDQGTIRCYLYDNGEDFPDAKQHVIAAAVALPAARAGTCRFSGVTRDRDYAIVTLHDENNDNVFQKSAFGIPREGYGFSNNAKPRFSAPSFDACKFHYTSGTQNLAIAMQY
ncbi:MAG: DUF2141 domain-containing protein [Deltaproteobacteria bacterium]